MSSATALLRFSAYYGFDHGLLSGDDSYEIANADSHFDGRVAAIRLVQKGRFGNVFYQILHAVLLARILRCNTVELFRYEAGPPAGSVTIAGLTFATGLAKNTDRPTLVGHFFNSYPFLSAMTGFDRAFVLETVDVFLRPLFQHLQTPDPPAGETTLVMNFRGGDIFNDQVLHSWYVQPPASYYLRAALYAREVAGVDHVRMVAEDRLNPALPVVEASLRESGFDVGFQSSRFEDDLAVLMHARHLVSPFGTLCEAVAMLSTHLRSYFAFRQFESHRHQHVRRPALLTYILQQRGVRPVRIVDQDRTYIPPRTWEATDAQLALLRSFPIDRLSVQDLTIEPDTSDDCFESFPPSPVMTAAAEAHALRTSLISVREELAAVRGELATRSNELAACMEANRAIGQELAKWRATLVWRVYHKLRRTFRP